jgi:hypothetical protein
LTTVNCTLLEAVGIPPLEVSLTVVWGSGAATDSPGFGGHSAVNLPEQADHHDQESDQQHATHDVFDHLYARAMHACEPSLNADSKPSTLLCNPALVGRGAIDAKARAR